MDKIKSDIQALEKERAYLQATRSVAKDERFITWFDGFVQRFGGTVAQIDALEPKDIVGHALVKGQRQVYQYEIKLIESADERIKVIDERLEVLNKQLRSKRKGNDGYSSAVPPKE